MEITEYNDNNYKIKIILQKPLTIKIKYAKIYMTIG